LKELPGRWFVFKARGHPNVRATHRSTFEITKDDYLTPRGDCIVGVESEASAADVPEWLRREASKPGSVIVVVLCSDGVCDSAAGFGHTDMTMSDERRMVFRRSSYLAPDTVMIRSSKAARDLRRDLIERLKRGSELTVLMTVVGGGEG